MTALDALLALLTAIAATTLFAPRLRLSQPVALTSMGLLLGLMPGLELPRLDPDFVLLVLLPPLLYSDAFHTSWHDFVRWLRPILMLAIGLVAATTLAVGLTAHLLFPSLPWAVCFTLGAILSPTDTVAAQAVLERLRIPRRTTAILGGESLVNDATGLVGVQVGVAMLLSGVFELADAATRFAWVSGAGVGVGLLVGLCFAALNRVVKETNALFVLSLVAPYLAALIALRLEASSVLAVVSAGFFVSWRIHLIDARSRVPLYATWNQLVFLLNGIAFVYIGIETPARLGACSSGASTALLGALALALVVILTRIAWMFPAAYVPLWLSPRLRAREGGLPEARYVVLASWCGVRGIVSLAAALSLPEALDDGAPFPGRDLVVFVTLVVVLVTLGLQGSTLEPLVRRLGIRSDPQSDEEVRAARERLLEAGIARLDQFCSEVACPLAVHHLRTSMVDELAALRVHDTSERTRAQNRLDVSREVRAAVYQAQSEALLVLRDAQCINDLVHAELQLELDRVLPVAS